MLLEDNRGSRNRLACVAAEVNESKDRVRRRAPQLLTKKGPSMSSLRGRRAFRLPQANSCLYETWVARGQTVPPKAGPGVELSPQLTAFFTSAPILASSAAVNSVRAK